MKWLMQDVPRTPASGRRTDIDCVIRDMVARVSILSLFLSHRMCRAFRHRADVRTSTTSSATWFSSQHSFAFPLPHAARSTPAAYAVRSYFYWIWYWDGPGTSTAVVRVEVVDHGTASQAVVQKSATGAVQWVPIQEMMSHSFSSQLDSTTHSHDHTTFCLNPRLYSSSFKGTFSTSHRTGTWFAPNSTVTATTDMLWTLVCERRQDIGQLLGATVSVSGSMGTRARWDTATDANDPKGAKDGRVPTSEVHGQNC